MEHWITIAIHSFGLADQLNQRRKSWINRSAYEWQNRSVPSQHEEMAYYSNLNQRKVGEKEWGLCLVNFRFGLWINLLLQWCQPINTRRPPAHINICTCGVIHLRRIEHTSLMQLTTSRIEVPQAWCSCAIFQDILTHTLVVWGRF